MIPGDPQSSQTRKPTDFGMLPPGLELPHLLSTCGSEMLCKPEWESPVCIWCRVCVSPMCLSPWAHACCWMVSIRTRTRERFPSGSGAKNLLAGARDKDPVPEPSPMDPAGSGKIPLASEQTCPWPQLRSLCSRAWQPQLLSPCVATTKAWEP